MNFSDIFLVIISSAGLLHGLLFAVYLVWGRKKKTTTNLLLGLILTFMAFRIGKSVMLNFGDGLEPVFIFIGLALLLLIGPLLRWYVAGMITADFKLSKKHLIELIPFVLVLFLSLFFIEKPDTNKRSFIILFASVLLSIYFHFATYIAVAGANLRKAKRRYAKQQRTKSQEAIYTWLTQLLIGFVIIWISYVLNILDDTVPYIIGPIIYSVAVYYLSFAAFQSKIVEIDGTSFKTEDDNTKLFEAVIQTIVSERRYLEPDLSLSAVGDVLGKSTQKISSVINQYAKRNFNDFINYHRIQEAKTMLSKDEYQKFTISSIAYDSGFSSLSSFNSAFKKFEGVTPSAFKKNKNYEL